MTMMMLLLLMVMAFLMVIMTSNDRPPAISRSERAESGDHTLPPLYVWVLSYMLHRVTSNLIPLAVARGLPRGGLARRHSWMQVRFALYKKIR